MNIQFFKTPEELQSGWYYLGAVSLRGGLDNHSDPHGCRNYGHLPVITGYFYGIIHSINGVTC